MNGTPKAGLQEEIADVSCESNENGTKPINEYGSNNNSGGNNSNGDLFTYNNNNDHDDNNSHTSDTYSHLGPNRFASKVDISILSMNTFAYDDNIRKQNEVVCPTKVNKNAIHCTKTNIATAVYCITPFQGGLYNSNNGRINPLISYTNIIILFVNTICPSVYH